MYSCINLFIHMIHVIYRQTWSLSIPVCCFQGTLWWHQWDDGKKEKIWHGIQETKQERRLCPDRMNLLLSKLQSMKLWWPPCMYNFLKKWETSAVDHWWKLFIFIFIFRGHKNIKRQPTGLTKEVCRFVQFCFQSKASSGSLKMQLRL